MSKWSVIVKDKYPAYVSWETFEEIQKTLDDNYAEYDRKKTRGVPRGGEALLQGIAVCGRCGHQMVVQYSGGGQYICNFHRQKSLAPVCQALVSEPIDTYVVGAFMQALSGAELDVYEAAMRSRQSENAEVDAAQDRELQRLRYEADLARRQYDRVDPDNRLVASELERRWEAALRGLRVAEERIESMRRERDKVVPLRVPGELRRVFEDLGRSLPDLWAGDALGRDQRKALLRALIDKVVIRRAERLDGADVRIVWKGGAHSEAQVDLPVASFSRLSRGAEMERRLLELVDAGETDEAIAATLTEEGFRSPKKKTVIPSTVVTIRHRHGRLRRPASAKPHPIEIPGHLTIPQAARRIGFTADRIRWLIRRGRLDLERSETRKRIFKVPDCTAFLEGLRKLCAGEIDHLSAMEGHQDG